MLEIRDLVCRYGKVTALKGVSLRADKGRFVALVGANGAGKSTLLRAVSGLAPVVSGEIVFEGRIISGLTPDRILAAGIAHCPEGRRPFPHMTVGENLEMGAFLRRDVREVADDMARVFALFPRLTDRRRQYAGTLSGGEQQMLAIGRALMSRPKLILFDEPSLGLAPNIVEHTFETIKKIQADGATVLMVEQNAYAALEMCDYAYLLEAGTLAMEGPGRKLIDDPHVRRAYLGADAVP